MSRKEPREQPPKTEQLGRDDDPDEEGQQGGSRRRVALVSPWAMLWLTVVWVLLWGSLDPLNILGGVLAALLVLLLFPLPRVELRLRVRPVRIGVLLARFLVDLVRASVEVAWLSVRPGPVASGVVMDLELAGDDPLLQTLTAEMVSLVPGSVVIDLDPVTRLLTLHALDVRTRAQAEQVRHKVRAQEARVLRALHPDPESLLDPRRLRPPAESPEDKT